jgi:membrane-associated phospholipid phosphatase
LLKAFARRRRPSTRKADYFKSIGPDQYSFPSGHASRAILIAGIFTEIYPLFDYGSIVYLIYSVFVWIWAFSVCISRLINGRHYLLDVVSGIGIGFLEAYFVSKLWLSSQKAENMLNVLFDDIPEI